MLAQAEWGWLEEFLVRLFDLGPVGPLTAIGLVLASVAIGAAHALAPGHGKAIIAAYLVGERGRPRDAVALGSVVTVMHTASVLAVGIGIYLSTQASAAAGQLTGMDAIAPWLTVAAGALVMLVGGYMLVRQLRRRRAGRRLNVPTTADAGGSGDAGRHGGTAGGRGGTRSSTSSSSTRSSSAAQPHHSHHHALPPDVAPLSRKGLVVLGTSGGLLPSPSAFLVLTTGLFTGRAAFALLLVAAFSLGLAATLTAIGLAVLWGRDRVVDRVGSSPRLAAVTRAVPLVSACGIALAGLVMTTAALLRAL